MTHGRFVLDMTHDEAPDEEATGLESRTESPGLICDALPEKRWMFEEIEKGQTESFRFRINDQNVSTHIQMLEWGRVGSGEVDVEQWSQSGAAASLLVISLCSTFVGMCLPGQGATFLDFNSTFFKSFQSGKEYILEGQVGFKSESMRTIVENIEMRAHDDEKPSATAKVNVKVNEPPVKMPTIEILREQAGELHLKDKVVLITGGSRGIGETTAKLFSVYGAKVAINYFRGEDDALRIVREIEDHGGEAIAVGADISDHKQVEEMVKTVRARFQTVQILVNNAVRDAIPIPFMDLSWTDIQRDIDVTLKGAFHCSQAVIPLMQQNQSGKIINVSTIFTEIPVADQAKYIIAKSGLIGLTRSLAVEFAKDHIQVNAVVPSIVETDLSKHVPRIVMEEMKQETPMNRNATPMDVARSIVFSSLINVAVHDRTAGHGDRRQCPISVGPHSR